MYEAIKSVAKEKGVPIYKIEQDCHISRGSICKWGVVSPSVEKVKAVADYLGVTVDYLIADSGKKKEMAGAAV